MLEVCTSNAPLLQACMGKDESDALLSAVQACVEKVRPAAALSAPMSPRIPPVLMRCPLCPPRHLLLGGPVMCGSDQWLLVSMAWPRGWHACTGLDLVYSRVLTLCTRGWYCHRYVQTP
jgi:hypothetical protein